MPLEREPGSYSIISISSPTPSGPLCARYVYGSLVRDRIENQERRTFVLLSTVAEGTESGISSSRLSTLAQFPHNLRYSHSSPAEFRQGRPRSSQGTSLVPPKVLSLVFNTSLTSLTDRYHNCFSPNRISECKCFWEGDPTSGPIEERKEPELKEMLMALVLFQSVVQERCLFPTGVGWETPSIRFSEEDLLFASNCLHTLYRSSDSQVSIF